MSVAAPNLAAALLRGIKREKDTWDEFALHVSDLSTTLPGEGCPRELKLRLQGAEKRPKTLGEALMHDHGHRIHERAEELLAKGLPRVWRIIHTEMPIRGLLPFDLVGSIDTMLEHIPTRARRILDKKTARGRAMNYVSIAPKPGHVLQVQGYGTALDLPGDLLYIDREGQNGAAHHPVERNDHAVMNAIHGLVWIRDTPELPPILKPVLKRNENKGPDSLSVVMPWVCDYCRYRDVSCDGALPYGQRDRGIVAKQKDDGTLLPVKGQEDMLPLLEELLANEPTTAPDQGEGD